MKHINCWFLLFLTSASYALNTQTFRDNTDLSVLLSDSNYNRLVVRQDKITKAHFPEGSMAVKNEEDGSLYVMVAQKEPFTLFLTTESGHHFSVTVQTENALGKTIEFVPQTVLAKASPKIAPPQNTPVNDTVEKLMQKMTHKESANGYEIKQHYGRVIRFPQGLTLIPKLTYNGLLLEGEVTEIYNGGKLPINLNESLFMSEDAKAISFSQTTLAPKQKAYLYRVVEKAHA